MRTEFLCISVLIVASGPRMKLAGCESALSPPVVCSADRSRAVVPVLVLLFLALWFILRGHLLYVFPYGVIYVAILYLIIHLFHIKNMYSILRYLLPIKYIYLRYKNIFLCYMNIYCQ